MTRRAFLAALAGAAATWPLGARAQASIPRIGWLSPTQTGADPPDRTAFLSGLRDLGYVDGETVHIEFRYSDGGEDRLAELARELVDLKVDLIVSGGPGVYAAARVTKTVPIVAWVAGDLVGQGLAESLAHPGGNVTGMTFFVPQLNVKRIELLKEVKPSMTKVGLLLVPSISSTPSLLRVIVPAAKAMGVELEPIEVADPGDCERTLGRGPGTLIGGLVVTDAPQFVVGRGPGRIAAAAATRGLPSAGGLLFAVNGGLLSYGVDFAPMFRRAAAFVDKILKGAKPGDIPIEQATKFETIVNLKTAKALGVEIPGSLLAAARGDRMRRRDFLSLVGGAVAWPLAARAQANARIPVIGYLSPASHAQEMQFFDGVDPFREGLRALGYVEGKTVEIEPRFAEGHEDRLAGLAAELVAMNVDVIVTYATGIYAAHGATTNIPIVLATGGDLVAMGLAESLAHPGGNITGTIFFIQDLMAKRLELLKAVAPSLERAGVLLLKDSPAKGKALILEAVGRAAGRLKVEALPIEVREPADLEPAIAGAADQHVAGLVVLDHAFFAAHAAAIAALAIERGLPSAGALEFVRAGGLIGYGVKFPDLFHLAARQVDKILKGAKPADLPIEQATRFETIVNLKTAHALGIDIPTTLLAAADEVIE